MLIKQLIVQRKVRDESLKFRTGLHDLVMDDRSVTQ